MKAISTISLIVISLVAHTQSGTYLLTHYQPEGEAAGQTTFDMVQDSNGLMYFAVSRGVLRFDGSSWDLLPTGGAVYDLLLQGNLLYTAGSNGAGRIDISNTLHQTFTPLSSSGSPALFQIAASSGNLFFISDRQVYAFADSVRLLAQTSAEWLSLTSFADNVYISSSDEKSFVIRENKLIPAPIPALQRSALVFAETLGNLTLLCTTDNRLYLLEGGKYLRKIQLADSAYADAGNIVNGCWITPDLVALGTLRGGVLIVNPHTGKTEQIINYLAGLPDNEVYAIGTDRNKNVWVVHRYGLTRIAPFIPFRSFAHYSGLQGKPLCAERFNGVVYVGTSLGLYQLHREDRYDEMVYYVNVPVIERAGKNETDKSARTNEAEQAKDRSGLFGFLRRRKPVAIVPESRTEAKEETTLSYRREKRKRRILRSSAYAFRKISGIDARISQLLIWNEKLVASGLAGVWEVNGDAAKPLMDEPVRYLFSHDEGRNLIAVTYEGKVYRLSAYGNAGFQNINEKLDDAVQYAFSETDGTVWLCGTDKVQQLKKNGELKSFFIENPDYDPVYGVIHENRAVFLASGRAWSLNEQLSKLVVVDSLSGFAGVLPDGQSLWLRTINGWRVLGHRVYNKAVSLLSVIPDITNIHAEQSTNNLWISTLSGELIYFRRDVVLPVSFHYPLLFKSIKVNDQPAGIAGPHISMVGEDNSLHVRVVLPEFNTPDLVQYRYRLAGLSFEWSDWSPGHAMLDFPFLPEGKYRLEIQAQSPGGHIADPLILNIHVLPPYWNRWWFYALEFGVFSLLVISSFRLSNRYRIVSRVLSLLSIIILIEFIQTVAGTTFALEGGPVIEFLVQVAIAFIILPVEGFLRNIMLRSLEKNKQE